jgi:hypothetical protein
MGQFLLVSKEKEFTNQVYQNVSSYLGADVVIREDAESAKNLLDLLPEIKLIISISEIAEENTGDQLIEYLDSKGLTIPIVILGDSEHSGDRVHLLKKDSSWEDVVWEAARVLGVSKKEMAKRVTPEFVEIPIDFFKCLDKTSANVFLRFPGENGKVHFVKKFQSGRYIDKDEVQELCDGKIESVYIDSKELQFFYNYANSRMSEMIEDDEMDLERRILILQNIYQIFSFQFRANDLTPAMLTLLQSVIDSTVYSVSHHIEDVNHLIEKFLKLKTNFSFNYFYMTSYICYELIRRVEWGNERMHEALVCSNFLVKSVLLNDKEVEIRSNDELIEYCESENIEKEKVSHHPKMALKKVERYLSDLPEGTSKLIKYHHGDEAGEKYPDSIKSSAALLVDLNLVATEIGFQTVVHRSLDNNLISKIQKSLDDEPFQKYFEIIKNLMTK